MLNLNNFEHQAYLEQFRVRNRVEETPLGSSFEPDVTETTGDRYNLISVVGLVLFVIMLILV